MQEKAKLETKFINHPGFMNWESYEEHSSVEGYFNTLHYLFEINNDMYAKVMEVIQPMEENRYNIMLHHSEVGMKKIESDLNVDEVLDEIKYLMGVHDHGLR